MLVQAKFLEIVNVLGCYIKIKINPSKAHGYSPASMGCRASIFILTHQPGQKKEKTLV
jgi:hypothetical protein